MRILHVLHTSLPYLCGYSIRSDYILRFQRDMGYESAVVTSAQHPNREAMQEEMDGVMHWRTPAYRGRPVPLLREMRLMRLLEGRIETAIAAWRPELIHAHSPLLVGFPALRAARRHGLPLVYEVRDLWENASVDRGKFAYNSPFYRLARDQETRLLRQADAVVTICEKLREELAPRAGRPEKVHLVGNGVDAGGFVPLAADPEARREWRLEGKRVLGYVGTFQPYEGLDTLIAALPRLLAREPKAHLLITGSGGQEPQLRAMAREMGLDAHITFTGRVPHSRVKTIYALADLMVYPRLLTRTTALTTPLKPLEAMAMARPVLVSDVPAMQELVQPEVTGLTFRAGDTDHLAARCAELLTAPERCRELGMRAREWVLRERQWPMLVARYRSIYAAAQAARA